MANRLKLTTKKKEEILDNLIKFKGHIGRTCKASGISRTAFYDLRKDDPEFKDKFEKTFEIAIDSAHDEAIRRAVDGVKRDIYYQGEVVGSEIHYSDFLLNRLLEAHYPGWSQKTEISGPGGKPIDTKVVIYLPDNERGDCEK